MKSNSIALDDLMPIIRERLKAGDSVQFSPRGTSMLPMLREGKDQVVLSPLPEKLRKYDLPLYRRSNGQYVLHRVVKAGEEYICAGDNQFFLERGLRHEQMIAVVSSFIRDGKVYSCDHFGYRLYCHFWHHTRFIRRVWRGIRSRLARFAQTNRRSDVA